MNTLGVDKKCILKLHGYTLVEILVVLAIIAVLTALIFAVLGPARERGRESVCTSQLHQWGLALAMYQQDYDAISPIHGKLMRPSKCGLVPITEANAFVHQFHLEKVAHCPSAHYPPGLPPNLIPKGSSYPIEFVYTMDDPQSAAAILLSDYGTDFPLTYCEMHNADVDFSRQPTWATKRVLVLRYDQHIQNEIVQAHAGPQGL